MKLSTTAAACASAVLLLACLPAPARAQQTAAHGAVSVHLITDEAEAVLAVLAKKRAAQSITDDDWRRVFASEGYTRLKRREHAMQRSFEDDDFKKFVLSDELAARAEALAATLARWKHADVSRSARLALRYLPPDAHITAKIYPVIKPRENSFVFDLDTDPAIFLYLDPAVNRPKFENTLAHELHHIGYGTVCPTKQTTEEIARLPQNLQIVLKYTRAFGEGFAMLAAAGGANIHPHAVSDAKERARWDADMKNFDADLARVEKFFLDVLANRLSTEQIDEQSSSFYGVQGAWYTVGWKMCAVIEKTFGRRALIETMCDPRKLLATYNRAAAMHNRKSREKLAMWSESLVAAVSRGSQ
jgi:Skp family chaperone for outer membrane proteins